MLPVPETLEPMEAKPVNDLPRGDGWLYEPKWEGYRCLAFREGAHVSIYSKRGTLLNRYFPEVVAGLAKLKAKKFVLDGELMVMPNGQPDFDNLQLRMHPAESLIKKLSAELPAVLMTFDLLADAKGKDLRGAAFADRRAALEDLNGKLGKQEMVLLSPQTASLATARDWLKMAGQALDGIVAKRGDLHYQPGKRAMQKFKLWKSIDAVVGAIYEDARGHVEHHDRAFLDDVTDRTLFLRPRESEDFALPYSRSQQALEERDAARDRQFENDMRKVKALRQQAAKLKNIGINSGSDLLVVKTRQLSERADQLEERARPAHQERSAGTIRLANSGTHAKALMTIDGASIATPDGRVLFRTGRLWIEKGDRVALLGTNGSGKTMFVRRLRAALVGSDPEIRSAASLKLGYSDQALSQLDAYPTPWEGVKRSSDLSDQQARSQLAGAGIGVDAQATPIGRFSGGQRARLAMLLLRLAHPNFYLLDEPTNHLDIEGQEMLEAELIEHGAAPAGQPRPRLRASRGDAGLGDQRQAAGRG